MEMEMEMEWKMEVEIGMEMETEMMEMMEMTKMTKMEMVAAIVLCSSVKDPRLVSILAFRGNIFTGTQARAIEEGVIKATLPCSEFLP